MTYRTIFVTLLLAWGPVLWQVAEAQDNWVTNGDFAGAVTIAGRSQCPVGWQSSDALVVAKKADAEGLSYVQVRAEQPPQGGAYVSQAIHYDRARAGTGGFEFSCQVKFDDCTQGPKSYMTARVLLLYTTADRIVHDHLARRFIGASDWRSVYIPCKFPPDTTQIQVLLGFHTSMGTFCVRNVRLIHVDSPRPDPQRVPGVVMRTVAPGIVETDYGVTRTLKVGTELWYKLPDVDPAAQWYNLPDPDGQFDPAFVHTPDWTAAERARGFVVFQHAQAKVAPVHHVPEREQILDGNRPIRLALCPGETRSAVAIVHPLRALSGVSFRFTGLTRTSGMGTIPPGNLRADHVETMFYRANSYRQYAQMPRAITRFDALDLPAGHGSQFWIYCTVPDGAAPGVYEGVARMLCEGKPIGQIPVRAEVYPFRLVPAAAHWSMYFYYPPDEQLLVELEYMQSIGMNSVIYSPPADSMFARLSLVDGQVRFNFTPDDQFMAAYRQAGFSRPVIYYPRLVLLRLVELLNPPGNQLPQVSFHGTKIPLVTSEAGYPPAARQAYKQFLRLVVDHATAADWPEMIFYLTDEPFETHWREFETAMSYKLSREACPEIKTYCTVYETSLIEKYGQYIDYISSRGLQRVSPRSQHREFLEACARTGSRPWASCWPPLWWHNYWYARAYAGFVNVRSGFEGNNIWFYPRVGKGVRDSSKSLRPGGSVNGIEILRRTRSGEFENSTILEGIREGVLDARYIATLEAAIQRAKQTGRNVTACKNELRDMIACAPELRADAAGLCWDRPGLADAGDWSVTRNEQLRQRIAQLIVALTANP